MKWIPLEPTAEAPEKDALETEYRAGRELVPATLGAQHLFFKAGRKVYFIPYARITRVFRRVEIVNARMGCCNNGLPVENLVVCGEGEKELAQIRFTTERAGKAALEALQEACPNAQFGYVRDPEQTTAVRQV